MTAMTTSIFDKTDKGREEISTRKYQLASRLRTLLLLVDGKSSAHDLLQKVTGISEQNIADLLKDGFIQAVKSAPAPTSVAPAPTARQVPAGVPEATGGVHEMPDGQTQFEAIYNFYTETIKSTIGLRGYGLQLKVEKASSLDDFRQLRQPYLEAVLKAKGSEIAKGLRLRLDELLYFGEGAPPQTTIVGQPSE